MDAVGFTTTTTVKLALLEQPFNKFGRTVMVSDLAPLEVLLMVPEINVLLSGNNGKPNPNPVSTFVVPTRLYVVPVGTIPFEAFGVTAKATPLQVTCVIPEIITIGSTVTTKLNGDPTQFPPSLYEVDGVTV